MIFGTNRYAGVVPIQTPKKILIGDNLNKDFFLLKGGFFMYTNTLIICRLSDSTMSEDAGIEPSTVATLALIAKRSIHSARSRPNNYNRQQILKLIIDNTHVTVKKSTVLLNVPKVDIFILPFYQLLILLIVLQPTQDSDRHLANLFLTIR